MGTCGVVFSIFNLYGHSGGAQDPKKAKDTSRILRACIQEANHFPANPKLILGDLNGDYDSFPELEMLCETMGWQDLNAAAATWEQQPNVATCRTALSHQPTIRDYCFACPITLPMVKQFRVVDADLCPVHSTLQVHIVPPTKDRWQHQSTPRRALKELMEEAFCDMYGEGPGQPPADLSMELEQLLMDPLLPEEIAKPDTMIKPHPFLQKAATTAYREAKTRHSLMRSQFIASAKLHMD